MELTRLKSVLEESKGHGLNICELIRMSLASLTITLLSAKEPGEDCVKSLCEFNDSGWQ